ncbi:MAG: agmatinase [Armatimonadota bacterium]|nr:agmatinase [Armatimonadota bacterium]
MQTTFLGVQSTYDTASVVLIPAPFDGTATYAPGARFGPRAILEASEELELYDREFGCEVATKIGIHTQEALEHWDSAERMSQEVRERSAGILKDGKLPVLLGGDHSVTLGAVQAAAAQYPNLIVVQLDAHADLRDEYHGNRFNHACVARRIIEYAPVLQAGIRSLCAEEAEWMAGSSRSVTGFREDLNDPAWWPGQVENLKGKPVYLTVDVDVLDPSVMPSTGTPEPGGVLWPDLVEMVRVLTREVRVVGMDCVELMPIPGLRAPDFAAAKLVYKMIALATRR